MSGLCVVFDLDDTLYPEASYARSGLRAAGHWAVVERGLAGLDVVREAVGETDTSVKPELSWSVRKKMDAKVQFILLGLDQHGPEF